MLVLLLRKTLDINWISNGAYLPFRRFNYAGPGDN